MCSTTRTTRTTIRPLFEEEWANEAWVRSYPQNFVSIKPQRGTAPSFGCGDEITVTAGSALFGGVTGAQVVYEMEMEIDVDGVVEVTDLVTSADQTVRRMRRLYRKTQATRQVSIENRVDALERRFDPDQLVGLPECACCFPPPGSLVVPAYRNGGGHEPRFDVVGFPGDVTVARITEAMMTTFDAGEDLRSPSRNAEGMEAQTRTNYDDESSIAGNNQWTFSPVDDFGLDPDILYGIWFSFRYTGAGTLNIESRSNNSATDSDLPQNSATGTRHPNSSTTPNVLTWADATNQTAEYPRLDYYGLFPVGGQNDFGDFPFQYGFTDGGMLFEPGEVITVRAWSPDGAPIVYLDHLVFMPLNPMGTVTFNGGQSVNFTTVVQEIFGYYVGSGQPASVTEPTDYGSVFGGASTVQDTQSLSTFWDPAGHFTIAMHDESDAVGLFSGVGGAHIYVLLRTNQSGAYNNPTFGRPSGHVTCFTGSNPLSDIQPAQDGAWVWNYAGSMPLGDGPQGTFGMMQWLADGENFVAPNGTTNEDGVRTAFVAYVPYAPCEAAGGNAGQ